MPAAAAVITPVPATKPSVRTQLNAAALAKGVAAPAALLPKMSGVANTAMTILTLPPAPPPRLTPAAPRRRHLSNLNPCVS